MVGLLDGVRLVRCARDGWKGDEMRWDGVSVEEG
jgi:hypothetical protein